METKAIEELLEQALATEEKLKAKWEKSIEEGSEISSGFDYANEVRSTEKGLMRQALALLRAKPPEGEFTKEVRELVRTTDDDKGWTYDKGYVVWLEVKLREACARIDAEVAEKKELRTLLQ